MLEGGVDAVRKRPGVCIDRPTVLVSITQSGEIVDNAVDEEPSGFGERIDVTINKDGS